MSEKEAIARMDITGALSYINEHHERLFDETQTEMPYELIRNKMYFFCQNGLIEGYYMEGYSNGLTRYDARFHVTNTFKQGNASLLEEEKRKIEEEANIKITDVERLIDYIHTHM